MDEKEKFLKIITKAESNGFSFRNDSQIDDIEYIGMGRFKMNLTITHDQEEGESVEEKGVFVFNITEVFFNHNFAKAFFGTHEVCKNCGHILKGEDWKDEHCSKCNVDLIMGNLMPIHSWQYHLKEMVLEEDIMEYLVKHVG